MLADQVFEVNQSAAQFLPANVTGHIRAGAAIASLSPFDASFRAGLEVDRQAIRLLPGEAILEELKISADGPAHIAFDALVSAAFPKIPSIVDLQEVGKLKLSTEGAWHGAGFDLNAIPVWRLPALPEQFRVSGGLGAPISISTSTGRLEIGSPTSAIRNLVLRNGRLEQLTLHTDLRELRTPAGPADLVLSSDISLPAPGADVSISGTVSGVDSFTVSGGPQKLAFNASGIHAGVLWAGARPLLQEFGVDTSWLHPEAHLRNASADLEFAQARLNRAAVNLQIEPGKLASVDLKAPFRAVQLESAASTNLHASLAPTTAGALDLGCLSKLALAAPAHRWRLGPERCHPRSGSGRQGHPEFRTGGPATDCTDGNRDAGRAQAADSRGGRSVRKSAGRL